MNQSMSEDEKEAVMLVALKKEEREASRELNRLNNAVITAQKDWETAVEALRTAREKFIRKVT